MVNVVHGTFAVADADQRAQYVDDVVVGQRTRSGDPVTTEPTVELHTPNRRQIVSLRREEQVAEQVLGGLLGGRLAGAHHAIDVDQCLKSVPGHIQAQRVGNIRPAIEIVGVDRFDLFDARIDELFEHLVGERGVALDNDLAGFIGNDVASDDPTNQIVAWHVEPVAARTFQEAYMAGRNPAAYLHEHVARAILDLEGGHFAAQSLRHQVHRKTALLDVKDVFHEKHVEDFLGRETQRAKNDRGGKFAASVDAGEHRILGIKLEVQPRTAIRNHSSVVEDLARRMRLSLVVVEKDAW